ncbi:MAG: RHS repeat protein, partial [Akkermansiaceae bacterium]|nr:RHS repeat protein [Akkermansiaceae bacterium]
MKKKFIIRNSISARAAQGVVFREVKSARSGDTVTFRYLEDGTAKQPSTPDDVLSDCLKRITVGRGEDDKALYNLSVLGTVDDSAEVRMAGQTVKSGSGAGVPISGEFVNIAAGPYEVYVKHTNIAYPEKQNASFLTCTVGPAVEVVPDPQDKRPPCANPCGCSSKKDTAAGGNGGAQRGVQAVESPGSRGSTSGGSGVSRASSANEMSWTAQFGVFRGLAGMPAGLLDISCFEEFKPELGRPEGLRWRHPLASSLALPEEGIAPGRPVELWDGYDLVNFLLDGSGVYFFKIGASVASATELKPVREMSREPGVACHIQDAQYIRASYPSGAASFYDLEEGRCVGYISEDDLRMDAEAAYAYMAIVRSEEGTIRQLWNEWDGLADVVPGEEDEAGGYAIRIYPPAQVSAPAEVGGLYQVSGEPVRSFAISANEEEQSLTIRERDHLLPTSYGEMVTTWRWAGGTWSMQEGEGAEAVITERVREDAADGVHYSVTVRQKKGGVVTTCTREEYEKSAAGNLLLSSTAGYGAPGELTTTYVYNTAGQLTARHEPGGGVYKTIYDEQGRVREESSPWGAGLSRTVQTTYRSDVPYSTDPARVRTTYFNGSSNPVMLNEEYTYKEQNHVRRVEKRVTAAGQSGTQFTVEETWLASAPDAFAAGRPRMRRDANGVQTFYTYAAASRHGALYSVTEETRVDSALVLGQSTRQVSYISAEGNTTREESYVLLSNGGWALTSGATHTYDKLNRLIGTTWDNGRSMTRSLTCQGQILEETDADGITTHNTYDSARQLVETTRSAVYDGEECITPEIITEYERDGEGRVTRTTVYTGPMKTETRTEYDLQGRVVKQVDTLGRETLTEYSEDGLTTTVTTPTGATYITTTNPDGSVKYQGGTGQRELRYAYDYNAGLRTITYLADGETILSIERQSGMGNTYLLRSATTGGNGTFLDTTSTYNEKDQLVQESTGSLAPVTYEYNSMGRTSRMTTLLDAAAPQDATKNRITTYTYGYEKGTDGEVYQVTTTQRNNPAGEWLTSTRKILISQLSPTLESKQISTDERGHTTTAWTEYGSGTQRI